MSPNVLFINGSNIHVQRSCESLFSTYMQWLPLIPSDLSLFEKLEGLVYYMTYNNFFFYIAIGRNREEKRKGHIYNFFI